MMFEPHLEHSSTAGGSGSGLISVEEAALSCEWQVALKALDET